MKEFVSNWGNYPVLSAEMTEPPFESDIVEFVKSKQSAIARGMGRSYGDASLHHTIISTKKLNAILDFNEEEGLIKCQAGISLEKILAFIVPKGFFLYVTPGTKYVSIGGAIAADVHGKNHHLEGSFSNYVLEFRMIDSDGVVHRCSKNRNEQLFWDTFGAMGRTGIILDATIRLRRIQTSYIFQEKIKVRNLREMVEMLEKSKEFTYNVAWLDMLKKGNSLGRGVLIRGEHARKNQLHQRARSKPLIWGKTGNVNIPFHFPDFLLSRLAVNMFNSFVYLKQIREKTTSLVHLDTFFYPLDRISNWNSFYGKNGFIQYHLVCPMETGDTCIKKVAELVSSFGYGSFLTVLKILGKSQEKAKYSFAQEGYTMAMDVKMSKQTPELVSQLDEIIYEFGGKVYLAKDAMSSKKVAGELYQKKNKFMSHQAERLLLHVR
ncbi:MAG: FAD-binding oxidoreductase [Ekhidna sp.]|nr:FAD-binding oxidoreductase [Ekhidna sp.]